MRSSINYSLSVNQRRPEEWLAYVARLGILATNTPAMPLSEAHFGGFFLPGVCR